MTSSPSRSVPQTPAARLRAAMDAGCTAIPGAFNALCARAIAKAGFKACYISGAATSVCAGVPDVGILTLEHFCRLIREVADAARDDHGPLPILADADTGFGEAEMVRRTVIEYARAGAAGLHLEDQKFPKRCGHLDGKELVPADHMVEKIQWAVKAARDMLGTTDRCAARPHHSGGAGVPPASSSSPSPQSPVPSAFLVCARTDARGVEGFDSAVQRARLYVEAGADMIFPEGLATEEEFARFASSLRLSVSPSLCPYLLANMTEFGKTPMIPLSRFGEMGYSCVIYPVSLLRIAMGALSRALEQLKQDGSVEALLPQMQTRKELYDLIQYTPGVPWEYHA